MKSNIILILKRVQSIFYFLSKVYLIDIFNRIIRQDSNVKGISIKK